MSVGVHIGSPGGVTYNEMVEYVSIALGDITVSGVTYDEMVEYVNTVTSGITISGVLYDEMVDYINTLVSGITISGVTYGDMVDYVGTATSGMLTGGIQMGDGQFTSSGTASIYHGFDNIQHFTAVVPGGPSGFNEESLAQVGEIYIELGINEDQVYTTGGTTASGYPYIWLSTTVSGLGITGASFGDLCTALESTELTLTFPDTLIQSSFFPVVTKTTVSGVTIQCTTTSG